MNVFAISISVVVLLAILAVAVSPLLAFIGIGLLFAAFLAFAWSRPVAHGAPTPAGVIAYGRAERRVERARV